MSNRKVKGIQGNENKWCVWYKSRSSLGRWLMNYTRSQAWVLTLGTGVYRRVRFRSCGTVGYGATMWVKSRKALTACMVEWLHLGRMELGYLSAIIGRVDCTPKVTSVIILCYTLNVFDSRVVTLGRALWGPRLISRDHRMNVYSDPRDQCSPNTQILNNKSLTSMINVRYK